jgi:hypothetical protein
MTSVIAVPVCAAVAAGFPVLSAMLRDASRLPPVVDWRSGVLQALGLTANGALSEAVMAARAVPGLPVGTSVCLGLPVHAVAGMSRMFLAAAESFELEADSREQLRLAFNAEFGSPEVKLHAAGAGWVLQAPFAAAANDGSPESLRGVALAREPAVSAEGRLLRRLGAEVEMWLSALPFNSARERRGKPPINSIWFWSGAITRAMPALARVPGGLFTNLAPDAWMAGLSSHCSLPFRLARDWHEVRETRAAVVILQPDPSRDVTSMLPDWESAWLVPARNDLASGRLADLRLQIGATAWQLPAPRFARWFRRARPWWQMVAA